MSNKLFKRKAVLSALEGIEERLPIGEDGLVVFSVLCNANQILVTNQKGYHYVQHEESTIHRFRTNELMYIDNLIRKYREIASPYIDVNIIEKQLVMLQGKFGISALANEMHCVYESRFIEPMDFIRGKKIVIYGAGVKGKIFFEEIRKKELEIVEWVDQNYKNLENVSDPKLIKNLSFDYILIAIESYRVVREVILFLMSLGVPYHKILPLEKEGRFIPFE